MNLESSSSVLIVDDEAGIRTALCANFRRSGWKVEAASGVGEANRLLKQREFDLVVSDMRMPDGDGMEVIRAARTSSSATAVILLTAFGTVPDAVLAMRNGAFDYMTKPVSFEQLQLTAAKVMQPGRTEVCEDGGEDTGIVGRAPKLLRALDRARAAATTDADVLIECESGTGKELLARFIHDASSRSRKSFVAINCAAVPEHLLESELFGHARGAFTGATTAKIGKFELADGGTLLLDEIGEMPLNLQPKLLRALQEREFERLGETRPVKVNIRVIATTNVDLADMVDQGKFRSDLYYRLNVIPLSMPPLRERGDDIDLLARHFAQRFGTTTTGREVQVSSDFIERLKSHDWPGNVRELGNFMRRVCSLHPGVILDGRMLRSRVSCSRQNGIAGCEADCSLRSSHP